MLGIGHCVCMHAVYIIYLFIYCIYEQDNILDTYYSIILSYLVLTNNDITK